MDAIPTWVCRCNLTRTIEVPECFLCDDTAEGELGGIINQKEPWICTSDTCLKEYKYTFEETTPIPALTAETRACPSCNTSKLEAAMIAAKKLSHSFNVLLAQSAGATSEEITMAARFSFCNLNNRAVMAYGGANIYGIPVNSAHPVTATGLGTWQKRVYATLMHHKIKFALTSPNIDQFAIYRPSSVRYFGPVKLLTKNEFNFPHNRSLSLIHI